MSEQVPDWEAVMVDGEPDKLVNAAMVAEMIKASPIGVVASLGRLRAVLPAHEYRLILSAVKAAVDKPVDPVVYGVIEGPR